MREKLQAIVAEHDRLSGVMSTQEVASDPEAYRKYATAQSELNELVRVFNEYLNKEEQLAEATAVLRSDEEPDILALAEDEVNELGPYLEKLEQDLRMLLLPKDPNDNKNTIVEIRAGTGGEEAGLFAADLFRMYTRYAELKKWKLEILDSHLSEQGGYKAVSFQIIGDSVYSQLKWEGGVHRVQRVPDTETQGRVHTSAVTVAVLPEAEEVDIAIDPNDLVFDVYRSSGPGGQSVNTTDSAVRITHKPTGLVVTCQDEKSQHKNKAKALKVLRARLLDAKIREEAQSRSKDRKTQVGSGDRSERIRTYNFPQNRLTDHRINLTLYSLEQVMQGGIQDIVDALIAADRAERLAEAL